MTTLTRTVRRRIPAPRRDLVVELAMVGGEAVIGVREKGRRTGYAITVSGLHVVLAKRAADQAAWEKQQARRRKRGRP